MMRFRAEAQEEAPELLLRHALREPLTVLIEVREAVGERGYAVEV